MPRARDDANARSRVARTGLVFSLAFALLVAAGVPVRAAEEPACSAPATLLRAGFRLPFLAASLKQRTPTTILVLNSAAKTPVGTPPAVTAGGKPADGKSADGKSADGMPRSFQTYIKAGLVARYPEGNVEVVTHSEPRLTAEAIVSLLPALIAQSKPALLIWQTGTYDAIRGVDVDDFGAGVDTGLSIARAANVDVVLISPQYSPRTDFAFDVSPYVSTLRWVARSNGVPLFDRYALMRYWDEESVFDFDALRASPSLFNNVHRCIGRLLVRMIADGVDVKTSGSL